MSPINQYSTHCFNEKNNDIAKTLKKENYSQSVQYLQSFLFNKFRK